MNADMAPVTLEGRRVRLEPLTLAHVDPLTEIGLDPSIWRYIAHRVETKDHMRAFVEQALEWQRAGTALPFATIDRESGRVVGTTRFANIVLEHRRAEIGWTWITPAFQRTHVNTEAKYLMLGHAFETLGWIRVELKTSALNAKSRAAILRIGATEEGTFRRHMLNADGTRRDSVYFSVIDEEWPEVKQRLEAFLNAASDGNVAAPR
jgi:RimJ/RimL family protein N-acetyltransferase